MWRICRLDIDPDTEDVTYFEVQAASKKRDLNRREAVKSGFVGPYDSLAIIGPDDELKEWILRPDTDDEV